MRGLALTAKIAFVVLAIALPLFGVWIASSLAAYQNASMGWVALAGLLAFPLLPLSWDAVATWRRQRNAATGKARPSILTFFDRFVLRTFAINLVFIAGLLALDPNAMFTALSTRGDWMLDHARGPWAERSRAILLGTADRMQWMHEAFLDNPYEDLVERDDDDDRGPGPIVIPDAPDAPADARVAEADPFSGDAWPFRDDVHPVVAAMPAAAEASIESVARYIAERETDPVRRIKALHDWTATRIAYDAVALAEREFPPQDAETTFASRRSVCAGYANLMAKLGELTGDRIEIVTGQARGPDGDLGGIGHAWNAVQIGERWYLLDATWDAGTVDGRTFTPRYATTFFMSPPEVFGTTHFPDDSRWQLRQAPLTRGEFLRQPNLSGDFFALGFALREPTRSQTTVTSELLVQVDNPADRPLVVAWQRRGASGPFTEICPPHRSAGEYRCDLPSAGEFHVAFFSDARYLGALSVNARG